MAEILSTLRQWSATASSNPPAGTVVIGTGLDDNLREIQAVVRKYLASVATPMASATTVDLSTADGYYVNITGTTTITGLGTEAAGIQYLLRFSDVLTFTHNATSLIIPNGANVTTAAGDIALMISEGSGNWRCISYEKAGYINGPATDLKSATTVVNVGAATAPSTGQVLMATSSTAATWQTLGATGVYLGATNIFTKNQSVASTSLTSTSNSVAVDASLSNNFEHTLTEDTTIANPTNMTSGMQLFFRFKQHASSAKTLAFDTKFKFSSTDTHTMPTGASAVAVMACYYCAADDRLECVFNGGTGFA